MTTRATISVDSPETSMSIGTAWSGTAWNSDGFCVNTAARIWMDAVGDSATSSFSALSNDASGQLLLQSLSSNVYLFADMDNIVCTPGSLLFAGANGVRMAAGHGEKGYLSGLLDIVVPDSWEPPSTNYVNRITPSDTDPSSDHAQAYIGHLQDIADGWQAASLALLVPVGAVQATLYFTGLGGSSAGLSTALAIGALATQAAGGTVSMTRTGGGGPPGLDMFSIGEIALSSTGFLNLFAGTAVMMTGLSCSGVGLVAATVTAGVRASMKTVYRALAEGQDVQAIGGTKTQVHAKKTVNCIAKTLDIGAALPTALTQLATSSVKARSVDKIEVGSDLLVKKRAGGDLTYTAPTIDVTGNKSVVLKSSGYEIKISLSGIEIAIAKKTKIVSGATSIIADAAGQMSLEVSENVVACGSSSMGIACDTYGSWQWKAPLVNLL